MKRILSALFLLVLLSVPALASQVYSETKESSSGIVAFKTITFTFTAVAEGAITAEAINAENYDKIKGWYLFAVEGDPGTTAPTDNWDAPIVNSMGSNVAGNAAMNFDATTSESRGLLDTAGNAWFYPVTDTLTVTPAGNSEVGAIVRVRLLFVR